LVKDEFLKYSRFVKGRCYRGHGTGIEIGE